MLELLVAGHDVLVLDNLSTGHRELVPGGTFVEGDLGDAPLPLTLDLPTQRRGWLRPDQLVLSTRYPLGLFRAWSIVEIDDASLCRVFDRIDQARGETGLTYFEFGTLAALDLFVRAEPDLAILEVGSPEYGVTRNYLDWLTILPWGISSNRSRMYVLETDGSPPHTE